MDHQQDMPNSFPMSHSIQSVSPICVKQTCDIQNCDTPLPGDTRKSSLRFGRSSRAIRFEVDQEENIKEHYAESKMILTDEDQKNMWWSRCEVSDIKKKARKVILHYRINREDHRVDFLRLFAQCARSSHLEEYALFDRRDKISSRGLERHINAILTRYRNKYVYTLLDIQSKMPSDLIPELKSKFLCAKATQLSKPSRNLARFLAHQDAVEVADQVREELLHDSISTL
jgi:hypothetical protein